MQVGYRLICVLVDSLSFRGIGLRHVEFPEYAAFDVLHDEEHRADDFIVLAERIRSRYRVIGGIERADYPVFAVDGMRRLQEFARRFAAQYISSRRGFEQVGRIGLAAPELTNAQWTAKALDMGQHVLLERLLVEAVRFQYLPRTGELFLSRRHRGSTKKSGINSCEASTA